MTRVNRYSNEVEAHSNLAGLERANELLHRQDGAEAGFAVRNPLIHLRSAGQRIPLPTAVITGVSPSLE
jgi:hypothetical protein